MKKVINLLFGLTVLSLVLSIIFGEDSLGGAKHDYFFHEKFINLFSVDFKNTIILYGTEYNARNSPIFYIILSYFYKAGLTISLIKYLNLVAIIFLIHGFYICLKIKYNNINYIALTLLIIVILLSPTIRSLLIWPYPFIWALILFLYAINYFLRFNNEENAQEKLKFAFKNIFFVALASYFTPSFAVFSLYFFFSYFKYFRFKKHIIKIIVLNFILAMPALIYYHITDYYILNNNYPFPDLNLNFSNKIIIISSLIFFYFLPFFEFKELKYNIKNYNFNNKTILILFFAIINIAFFDFLRGTGGGIFFHLSNILLDNSIIIFFIFVLFLFLFYILNYINLNNLILFFILIIYNMQYTIYHKYFDPLLLFVFLFLFSFDEKKINDKLLNISVKNFILYFSFLLMSLGKNFINY